MCPGPKLGQVTGPKGRCLDWGVETTFRVEGPGN